MMSKAISTVVGSVIILLIVMALAGASYLFISGVFTGSTATTFELLDAYNDTITIRNSGTETINFFTSVRVDETSRKDWFFDDFSTNLDRWEFLAMAWTITNGRLTKGTRGGTISPEGVSLDNFIFDGKVKVDGGDGRTASIIFRSSNDLRNFYAFDFTIFDSVQDRVTLRIRNDGSDQTLEERSLNIEISNENEIRIIASGGSIKIFINDMSNPVINKQDSTHSFGQFFIFAGVPTPGRSPSTFDDIKINPYMEPGGTATFKVYDAVSRGRHTVRLCTSSMCNTGYITIQ